MRTRRGNGESTAGDRIPEMAAPGPRDGAAAGAPAGRARRTPHPAGHLSALPYVLLMEEVPARVRGKILLKN